MRKAWFGLVMAVTFLALGGGLCMAADGAPSSAAPTVVTVPPLLESLLLGALGGLAVAFAGYMGRPKLADGSLEPFNMTKFLVMCGIGAGVGLLSGWKHTDFQSAYGSLQALGLPAIAAMVWKAIGKKMPFQLSEIFSMFEHPTAPANPTASPSSASSSAAVK